MKRKRGRLQCMKVRKYCGLSRFFVCGCKPGGQKMVPDVSSKICTSQCLLQR